MCIVVLPSTFYATGLMGWTSVDCLCTTTIPFGVDGWQQHPAKVCSCRAMYFCRGCVVHACVLAVHW
jgi:hypothetical protein